MHPNHICHQTAIDVYKRQEYTFTAVHAEGRLFVRESPSMSAKILGSLSPGDSGEVLELGTDWALITSGDLTGYVYTQYLEPVSYTHLDVYKRQT